jgi:hypothetical protein
MTEVLVNNACLSPTPHAATAIVSLEVLALPTFSTKSAEGGIWPLAYHDYPSAVNSEVSLNQ